MSARRLPRTWRDTLVTVLDVVSAALLAAVAVGGVFTGEPLLVALAVAVIAAGFFARRCSRLRLDVTDRILDVAHAHRELVASEAELAAAYDELARRDLTDKATR